MSKIYEFDASEIKNIDHLHEYLEVLFAPALDWCSHNLNALYDGLSSYEADGEIVLKNANELKKFGDYTEKLIFVFQCLQDECKQWKFKKEI